jgi:SAM-dependent methyltransferase
MGVFDDIYQNNRWGFGSGNGSLPSVTKKYRKYLEQFIRDNHIKTVVDYGCGDWQFSYLIDWQDAHYTGLDIVPQVIEDDTKKYATSKISFQVLKPGAPVPVTGELLIVKDVLQHMSTADIKLFLANVLPHFKYALITNCISPEETVNDDVATGEFRPLDLRRPPYDVPAEVVLEFAGPRTFSRKTRRFFPAWKKLVLLVRP